MIGPLKHINPKTKILFFVFILIMVPCVILSYLSLQSINQKADNLRAKYKGTVSLVRDKLESEVFRHEANLRNSVTELFLKRDNDADLKVWLRNIESENPAFTHLFLVNTEGGLSSSSVSLGWNIIPESRPLINPQVVTNFNMAEKAEFVRKDYTDAIRLYQMALIHTKSSQEHALLLSRIGRCYFKTGQYKTGIKEDSVLVKNPAFDGMVGWTPDGSGIMFVSNRSGSPDLYLLGIRNGHPLGEPQLLRRDLGDPMYLDVTLDGRLFKMERKGTYEPLRRPGDSLCIQAASVWHSRKARIIGSCGYWKTSCRNNRHIKRAFSGGTMFDYCAPFNYSKN